MGYHKDTTNALDMRQYLWVLWALLCPLVGTFNIDISRPVIHHGEPGSYFGYAVAQHLDADQPWLLVGAPLAQTTQEGVERGGSVFRCRVMEDDCHVIPFDTGPSNQYENKSHQWMGATIASANQNTVIVACAPHYISYTRTELKREPVGVCYVSSGVTTAFTQYSPCKDAGWGHHREGHCQAGFSAALSENGTWLMIGAVGSYYWQGQLYSQNLHKRYDRYRTRESPKSYDDGYLGYSMVAGKFSRSTVQEYALGVPKGAGLRGKVSVFHQNATLMVNVTGRQLGEYFGYAVAASDLNGDGHSDLVVGAPFYTDSSSDAYETGRVQVFYYRPGISFHETYSSEVKGRMRVGNRFGSSIMGLGDINNDAFEDLAVGAPYDGDNGEGAVYIFLGSPSGIRPKPSQVISGAMLDDALRTFGFSLSGGNDMDANTYPDLLVGAYEADRTVFLRTRAVIRVSARVELSPKVIDLEERFCPLMDGTPVVCINIDTCLSYNGRRVPSEIHLSLSWTLDPLVGRIFLLNGTERDATMQQDWKIGKHQKMCQSSLAYLRTPIRDKLSPITVSVNYSLLSHTDSRNRDLPPILDHDLPNNATGQAIIWRNCGDDNVCVPDLRMRIDSRSPAVTVGVPNDLEIYVHVENAGEDAFEAAVRTRLPPGVNYRSLHRIKASLPVRCAVSELEEDVVVCDIGNPLLAGTRSSFVLRVSPLRVNGTERFLDFEFNATSANPEDLPTLRDNIVTMAIPVLVVTEIQLTGASRPEQVFFNASALSDVIADEHAGPDVDHVYEIRNVGPGALDSASLEIHWPSFLGNDLDLLYLTFEPEIIEGTGRCEAQLINHRGLEVALRDFGLDELLSRERRSTSSKLQKRMAEDGRIRKVNCESDSDWCTIIRCDLGPLEQGESAVVLLRSRLWVHTLALVGLSGLIISSRAIAQVMSVPYDIKPEEYFIDTFQVDTYAAAVDVGPQGRPLQIWIIALAVSCGVVLLLLLILCLWRCGFFRRQTSDDMERLYQAKKIRNTLITNSNGTKSITKYDSLPGDAY